MAASTVLFIDPDGESRELNEELLRFIGYRPVCAATASEALDLARVERPVAVVTELLAPPPEGFAIVEALKTGEATHSTPVLVLSAYVLPEDRAGALAAGASAFLSKPCEVATLECTLARITGSGHRGFSARSRAARPRRNR